MFREKTRVQTDHRVTTGQTSRRHRKEKSREFLWWFGWGPLILMAMNLSRWRDHKLAPILTVTLLTFVVFAPTLFFDFSSYDDGGHIQENPMVMNLDFAAMWKTPYFGMYIPVTYTIWGLTKVLTENASAFHALNVFFHVANAALVFWLFMQWGFRKWVSVSAALLFSLHPVQVESVAWISSFRDVLSAFWGLLFLNLVFRIKENWKTVMLFPLLILSILSKPSGVVFAFVPAVYWFWQSHRLSKQQFFSTALWSSIALSLAMLAKSIQPAESLVQNPNFLERLAIMSRSLAFYSWKLLDMSDLSPDYGLSISALEQNWAKNGFPYFQIFAVVIVLGVAAYFFLRKNPIAFGIALAVLLVSPYLGIIPFNFQNTSIVADRYMYLAVIGICFSLAVFEPRQHNKVTSVVNVVIWAIVIFMTMKQVHVWKNDKSLYSEMLAANPNSYMANNGLGNVALHANDLPLALSHFEKAVTINPGYYYARYNLARAYELAGDPGASQQQYIQTINSQPGYVPAYFGLAALMFNQRRYAEAHETAIRGLAIAPSYSALLALKAQIEEQLKSERKSDR